MIRKPEPDETPLSLEERRICARDFGFSWDWDVEKPAEPRARAHLQPKHDELNSAARYSTNTRAGL